MNILRTILLSIGLMTAVCAGAQSAENVSIKGDHGMLNAVIQRPKADDGAKQRLVIICHGFTANKDGKLLRCIADSLQAKGIASLRFDFNGHGKSEGRFEDMTVLNEIEDARRVVAWALQQPWVQDISLVGHSQGGVVASMLAGELQGGVRSVVLCAPAAVLRDDALRGQLQGATYDATDVPATVSLPGRNLRVGRQYCVTAQSLPIYETACRYEGPALMIHGTADRIVPYTYSQRYQSGYKNGAVVLLPGVDHSFTVAQSRERAAALASDFIAKH